MPGPGFQLPTFNLDMNVWHGYPLSGPWPPTRPADFTFKGQLAEWSRLIIHITGATGSAFIQIRAPKGTDLRGQNSTTANDVVEAPAGTGRYYQIVFVDDVGKGFSNEYRLGYAQWANFPTPLP
jgi:hypothetical protein